jgi:hypothetical protein
MLTGRISSSRHTWRPQQIPTIILRYVSHSWFLDHGAYSPKWCCLCNDFGAILVLCSGCRVAVCVQSEKTVFGCVYWNSEVDRDDFIFYCRFCAHLRVGVSKVCSLVLFFNFRGHSSILPQLRLVDQYSDPEKRTVLFRYDPAVIVAGITWHEKKYPYVKMLAQALQQSYVGHEEYVCHHEGHCSWIH